MDENAIARLASTQRGVVSAKQLHAAGLDGAAIKRRCRAGRLHRIHRGVYLVGHTVVPEGAAEVAAILACGPGSVVSHRSAAHLWGMAGCHEAPTPIEVTVPGRNAGRKPGIIVYRARGLHRRDVRRVDGIPVTAPARTLLDLATVVRFDDLEVADADARARRLARRRDLAEVLGRHRGRHGAKALRHLLELDQGHGLTRSQAERRLLALLRTAALPTPQANARIGRFEVDFLWQDQKVIVEVDGYAFHSGGQAFERDRERDATLAARGYVVLRVTWRQLIARRDAVRSLCERQGEQSSPVIARLAAALSLRS